MTDTEQTTYLKPFPAFYTKWSVSNSYSTVNGGMAKALRSFKSIVVSNVKRPTETVSDEKQVFYDTAFSKIHNNHCKTTLAHQHQKRQ